MFRLLTYNILHGGRGRLLPIAAVINSCTPDLVLVQEATDPAMLESIAEDSRETYRKLIADTQMQCDEIQRELAALLKVMQTKD